MKVLQNLFISLLVVNLLLVATYAEAYVRLSRNELSISKRLIYLQYFGGLVLLLQLLCMVLAVLYAIRQKNRRSAIFVALLGAGFFAIDWFVNASIQAFNPF